MTTAAPAWMYVAAGAPLRPWQHHAVEAILASLATEGGRTCLVAPPGAGKTRCALHVASLLERPLEVRVPTTALVAQWEARIREVLVPLAEGAEPPVHVATYAGLGTFAPGALVVLDEAHHLGGAWGRGVEALLAPAHRVLGLTATPPEGSPGWDRFLSLVGRDPVVVETPPLVREGILCPYRDLAWPVLTDLDDLPALREAEAALRTAEAAVGDALLREVDRRLREDLWTLTEQRFAGEEGLLVALCRVAGAAGRHLPADLAPDPELLAAPTLHDRARVLHAVAADHPAVRPALRVAGFRPVGAGLVLDRDVAALDLASSRARIRGCLEVLREEERLRGEGLRALVLVDRDVEGDRLSAREVLRALVADPAGDRLDPILVTGSVFWVDDDLWPRLAPRLPPLPWQAAEGHHEADVSGWSVAERVALATRLLAEGTTRCLLGTHHLLGEGWDCPPVNVVVDLTGIVASVTANQVRGRAFRRDPHDPSKVAALWEVVTLAPGVAGGDRMLVRLGERHRRTFGVDDAGRVRAGVARVDPALGRPLHQVAPEVPALQARMAQRAGDLSRTAALWAVGRDYLDRKAWRLEGGEATPARRRVPGVRPETLTPAGPVALSRRRSRARWEAFLLMGGSTSGAVVAGALLASAGPVALAAGALLSGMGITAGMARLAMARRSSDREDAVLRALAQGLQAAGAITGGTPIREPDHVRLEGTPEDGRVFVEAARELLGPVRHPRYLLVEPDGATWPVPGPLGASRELADAFAHHWAATVGPCEVVWARQGRGRDLLLRAWRAGPRADLEVVEGWE